MAAAGLLGAPPSPLKHPVEVHLPSYELAQATHHPDSPHLKQSLPGQHLLPSGPVNATAPTNGSNGRSYMSGMEVDIANVQADAREVPLLQDYQARIRS